MATSNVKISVIIPVYNNEAYLDQCIESVTSQSLKDLELIIIDDGSLDDSSNIIDKHLRRDPRITLITLDQNMGVSHARNTGIDTATGDYIIFLDADDYWLSDTLLEILYSHAQKDKTDMVRFGMCRVDADGTILSNTSYDYRRIDFSLNDNWLVTYNITAVLILKDLIDQNVRFSPDLVMGEDALFSCLLYSRARSMSTCNTSGYAYRTNPTGANYSPWDRNKLFCTYRWAKKAIDLLGEDATNIRNLIIIRQVIGERLIMLSDRLLKLAHSTLSDSDFHKYINNWSDLLTTTSHVFQGGAQFMPGWSLQQHQLFSMLSGGNIEAIKKHINANEISVEQTTSGLKVTMTQQKAREIGKALIDTDKNSITLELGNDISRTLSRDNAHRLARQLIDTDKALITITFDTPT